MRRKHMAMAAAGGALIGLGLFVLGRKRATDPLANLPEWRRKMVRCAQDHVAAGTPYQWGGGRRDGDWGVDCSGLLINCGRKTGAVNAEGWDSRRMNAELPHTQTPQPGDAVFYAPRHVVMVETVQPDGYIGIIGSNGGDSSTTSPQIAASQKAFVKRAPVNYRTPYALLDMSPLAVK